MGRSRSYHPWPRAALFALLGLIIGVLPAVSLPTGKAFAAGTTSPSTTSTTTTTLPPSSSPPSSPPPPSPSSPGYWLAGSDGQVYAFGTTNFGGMEGVRLDQPVVGGSPTADGVGYWLVAADGGIFSFGDAKFFGSTGGMQLNKPIVGMAVDPATGGYWMVASDGGVFSFNAPFYGSLGAIKLNKPVVGMAVTPDGKGYWLVASDGGIFAFGDAGFYGSTGNIALTKPIVAMSATSDANGYWMVASDGGIFAFGDAGFYGSRGGMTNPSGFVGMGSTPDGRGYWLADATGDIYTFGDAPFLGRPTLAPGAQPIATMLETKSGYPFPPGGTGYDISRFQCSQNGGTLPPTQTRVAVVQVSDGQINSKTGNDCYQAEAAWAGSNISAYIFMNELPSPAPPESLTGPKGNCSSGDVACESYNFGYYWASHWVSWSRAQGVSPTLWWLDVESPSTWWANQPTSSNDAVISGAMQGLRSSGVLAGIYSTAYQWGLITGNSLSFPNMPLWVPGAGDVGGSGTYSATSFCAGTAGNSYKAFADGKIVLVQYGYSANGYTGAPSPYDQDYACQ